MLVNSKYIIINDSYPKISDEEEPFARSKEDVAIDLMINKDQPRNIDLTICAVHDHEFEVVDLTWKFDEDFILPGIKHIVFAVKFLFLLYNQEERIINLNFFFHK
jgi:hypothetical protein